MKNEIAVKTWGFGDQLIRTVKLNEEPWFVGKDVTNALGYQNTNKALNDHVDNEDKGVVKISTLGGMQNAVVINESGIYSLIFNSKLETARQFKRWVTSEVLPAIRKTGSYTKSTNEAERAQRYLHQTNANTQGLHAESGIIGQQIRLLDRVERLADRGILEQVVYGVRLKTAGKNKSLPVTTPEG